MLTLTRSWSIERDGENIFVVERSSERSGFVRYGPMPRDLTGPFIEERKQEFERMHSACLARLGLTAEKETAHDDA